MPTGQRFETMTNLATALETLGTSDLVKLYNAASNSPVNRFSDRPTAIKRTATAIERIGVGELAGLCRVNGIELPVSAGEGDDHMLDRIMREAMPKFVDGTPAHAMVPDHAPELARFEVGKTYSTRSIVDHDTVFSFKITARTGKQIQTVVNGKTVRRGLSIYDGVEQFKPFGDYSMCAVISARDGTGKATAAAIHDTGAKVTYAGAAIAAGLTPKQARKVAERAADRVIIENKVTGEKLLATAKPASKAAPATGKVQPTAKQAAMILLLVRPQGANRKELLAAMNAIAGASPSACIKLAELFGYDFEYIAKTETTPVQYRLTPKVAK